MLARVLPDTNVCFPISVLDLILRCDESDLHRIIWTDDLLEELERVWITKGARSCTSVRQITGALRAAFPDRRVERDRYERLIDSMDGPDPDDHVHAAAAVAVAPAVLLTMNLADFPAEGLAARGVSVTHPDTYFTSLLGIYPDDVRLVVAEMAAGRRRPPMTVSEVVDALARAGLRRFAATLRSPKRSEDS